jgi:transcriptional regulator with XRE-family HTH domain
MAGRVIAAHTGTGILGAMASETYSRHLIRMARREAGLTQQDLATRAATSQAAVSAYESGRRSPSVDTLCRILAAAGFEVRMRLAAPDTHDPSRLAAENLVPASQVVTHNDRERARIKRHAVDA